MTDPKPPRGDVVDEPSEITGLIGGKYRLGRLVGEGGMGAVYEAEHIGLGRRVAVKLLNEEIATQTKAVSRFRREARASAAIRHENIVSVYDTGTDEQGIPFLVMELLEGESLSTILRRERVLEPHVAAAIALQMLHGLDAAHKQTVIHRDLKPGNVFIARDTAGVPTVKILDFGISKFFSDHYSLMNVTASGAVVGTPRFMAPEQARGDNDLDERVDIYAVGVLLYRMVTGQLPYSASTQKEVIRRVLDGNATPPRKLVPALSKTLEAIILQALALDRDDRFASAAAFAEALTTAVPELTGDGPIEIPLMGDIPLETKSGPQPRLVANLAGMPTRPETPPPQRRPVWVIPALVVAALAIGLAVVGRSQGWFGSSAASNNGGVNSNQPADKDTLYFGMTRYLPRERLEKNYGPLLEYLGKALGRPVRLKVYEDYVDLGAKLTGKEIDLAALSSYSYVRAKRKHPTIDLLATHITAGGQYYEGYVLSRADSDVRSLSDLKQKVFCYVSPSSTSGYLYPRALFRRIGIDPDAAFKASRFTGDHLTALKALHSGACDGAAVFAGILFEGKNNGMPPKAFRILASTDRIPYDAYCARPGFPPELRGTLLEALLKLRPGKKEARSVFGSGSRIQGFSAAKDADYAPVRKMEAYLDRPKPRSKKR